MNTKPTIAIFAIVIAAFGIIAATSIMGSEDAFAKTCNPSGCKGDRGYYTSEGHHHCYEGSHGCERSGHYN